MRLEKIQESSTLKATQLGLDQTKEPHVNTRRTEDVVMSRRVDVHRSASMALLCAPCVFLRISSDLLTLFMKALLMLVYKYTYFLMFCH